VTARNIKNLSASVHERLLNKAKQSSRPFNELLQRFVIERFLYRLSKSPHADRFILKGALMLPVWSAQGSRPTMDIDLLGRIDNSLDAIAAVMREVCRAEVEPDGVSFDARSVTTAAITAEAEYEGVRVRLRGGLGNARVSLQIDIGFGDAVVPGPCKVTYPVLLDFPAPEVNGYTRESTIAEKLHAMVRLGVLNSRMKDFYDIWMLCRTFDFDGGVLAKAVEDAFRNRNTPFTANPEVFEPLFARDPDKEPQWKSFIRKTKLTSAPDDFEAVVTVVKTFLEPVAASLAGGRTFRGTWEAPGPWR